MSKFDFSIGHTVTKANGDKFLTVPPVTWHGLDAAAVQAMMAMSEQFRAVVEQHANKGGPLHLDMSRTTAASYAGITYDGLNAIQDALRVAAAELGVMGREHAKKKK